jgi:hypothetical protein
MDDPHGQPPRITSEIFGQDLGNDGSAALACAGAAVRAAARSFADRARGLSATSCSPGITGRRVRRSKLGGTAARSGRCRDPPPD